MSAERAIEAIDGSVEPTTSAWAGRAGPLYGAAVELEAALTAMPPARRHLLVFMAMALRSRIVRPPRGANASNSSK